MAGVEHFSSALQGTAVGSSRETGAMEVLNSYSIWYSIRRNQPATVDDGVPCWLQVCVSRATFCPPLSFLDIIPLMEVLFLEARILN